MSLCQDISGFAGVHKWHIADRNCRSRDLSGSAAKKTLDMSSIHFQNNRTSVMKSNKCFMVIAGDQRIPPLESPIFFPHCSTNFLGPRKGEIPEIPISQHLKNWVHLPISEKELMRQLSSCSRDIKFRCIVLSRKSSQLPDCGFVVVNHSYIMSLLANLGHDICRIREIHNIDFIVWKFLPRRFFSINGWNEFYFGTQSFPDNECRSKSVQTVRMVDTNSFHCFLFSIIIGTNFWFFYTFGRKCFSSFRMVMYDNNIHWNYLTCGYNIEHFRVSRIMN